ncbi:hypothetical protein CORC01_07140 [Colletotrichum orchidophilum]|uniref:Uncharacterized protein n=1 Tax=Colletotrichum orchidophilum TaxID=1209926 RepID=A0A1G4B8D7_9PEZI|nr:uncharacterized protein CORC01_07140 [Colletotrichum orchidophilum]OHE97525.1 hypothetical protein CORC01_07140 [Colletotrichum orchidophilum]
MKSQHVVLSSKTQLSPSSQPVAPQRERSFAPTPTTTNEEDHPIGSTDAETEVNLFDGADMLDLHKARFPRLQDGVGRV